MTIRVKNCGLKTPEAIDQSIATGASFAGFVHHAGTPRHLELNAMADLVEHARSRIHTVAVLVAPTDALLWEIVQVVKPDYLQLHKIPTLDRLRHIVDERGLPIISAHTVHTAEDVAKAAAFASLSEHLLFDAPQPGSGKIFDWSLLTSLTLATPWFLAGGLTAENVAEAIRTTGAPMVDVSSGLESAPGVKSLEKIAAFNAAVLHAQA